MRAENTDIDGELTDDRLEERASADPVGVDTLDVEFGEVRPVNADGEASNHPHRIGRRGMFQVMGAVGVAGVAGCLASDDDSDSENGNGVDTGESIGAAEIIFLDEAYSFNDVSCESSTTFSPENEQIRHRDADEEVELWLERDDPDASDVVEAHLGFLTADSEETVGEIEAYSAETTIDGIEFELGSGTSGTLHPDPSHHMNDDVEHDPDGGEMEWDISC